MTQTPTTDMWLPPSKRDSNERPTVVAIGGDGVGPEVIDTALLCIEALDCVRVEKPIHGLAAEKEFGTAFPDATKEAIDKSDAVFFGAVDSNAPGSARPILRYLRFVREAWANLRPAMNIGGLHSSLGDGINLVVVRELTEGMYPGREGDLKDLVAGMPELRDALGRELPNEGAFAVRVITERASARIGRLAGELALHRKAKGYSEGHVTIVDKRNVLRKSCGLFRDTCQRELDKLGVPYDCVYVDEAARRMVATPQNYDVVVTSNLFGDILSDVSAEAIGGMPCAPSAGIGDQVAYFEPCHGSAPDIIGKGKANPVGSILSGAMMLAHVGLNEQANRLLAALQETMAAGVKTADMGGSASTQEVGEAIASKLRA